MACYFCKKRIFSAILSAAKEDGYELLMDGTNADDDFLPRIYYRLAYTGLEEITEDIESDGDGREIFTAGECAFADRRDAVRDLYAFQSLAAFQKRSADSGEPCGELDGCKFFASGKRVAADRNDALREHDALQSAAEGECAVSDGCDAFGDGDG